MHGVTDKQTDRQLKASCQGLSSTASSSSSHHHIKQEAQLPQRNGATLHTTVYNTLVTKSVEEIKFRESELRNHCVCVKLFRIIS